MLWRLASIAQRLFFKTGKNNTKNTLMFSSQTDYYSSLPPNRYHRGLHIAGESQNLKWQSAVGLHGYRSITLPFWLQYAVKVSSFNMVIRILNDPPAFQLHETVEQPLWGVSLKRPFLGPYIFWTRNLRKAMIADFWFT